MTDSTTSEVNRTIVRRVWEEFLIQGNPDKADEFFAPDYVNHDPTAPEDRHGPEKLRKPLSMYHNAFPVMQFITEDRIAEGDKIVGLLAGRAPDVRGFGPFSWAFHCHQGSNLQNKTS